MKKYLFAVLSVLLLCATSVTAFASDGITPFADAIIINYNTELLPGTGGKVTATSTISAKSIASVIGFPTFSIQEYRDGTWVNVKTGGGTQTNLAKLTKTLTYDGVAGKQYRARTSYKAVVGGETSTIATQSSNKVTAK